MLRKSFCSLIQSGVSPFGHYRIAAGFYHSHSSGSSESPDSKRSNGGAAAFLTASALAGLAYTLFYKKHRCEELNNQAVLSHLNIVPCAKCVVKDHGDGPDTAGSFVSIRSQYNFIANVVEKVSPAVVYIKSSSYFRQGAGSGFIVSSDGLIVTNEHVVRTARNGVVAVELKDGRKYSGVVQAVDSSSDLALIKISETNLPTIKLGDSSSLRPGEWVIAMGSPLNLSNTVTSGIVSSTARKSSELGIMNEVDYLQTDAPITFGNSGGPLINLDGEAVGVNSMKVAEGISFAIPSDYVKTFLSRADQHKKLLHERRASRPSYIGASVLTLTPTVAAQLRNRPDLNGIDIDRGIFVVEVYPESPCFRAGLRKFDVMIEIDGEKVYSATDLQKASTGKTYIKCLVYRNGKVHEIVIRPQPLPAD